MQWLISVVQGIDEGTQSKKFRDIGSLKLGKSKNKGNVAVGEKGKFTLTLYKIYVYVWDP